MNDKMPSHDAQDHIAGKRVMVTGGCGFIGGHLVRRLVELQPQRVVVVDSMRYGTEENLGEAASSAHVLRFTLGADRIEDLEPLLRKTDCLVHLAAEKHNQSFNAPEDVIRTNIKGTHDLFVAAAQAGVKRCVFSSSLYAYGREQPPSMVETELPQPWTVYGISKLAGEHLLRHVQRLYGMQGLSLRYFFVYGPRQHAGLGYKSVIMNNFERMLRGEVPLVFGDGQQTLDYTYVDDIVNATLFAMASRASGEVINIGSGYGLSINDLTQKMLEVAECSLVPEHREPDWTAGTARVADTRRARSILGWSPQTSLAEGLAQTWHWIGRAHRV